MKTINAQSHLCDSTYTLTTHAKSRLKQRGLASDDVSLIVEYGEDVGDGFLMTDKAINNRKKCLASELQRLDKLRGVAVIEDQGVIITAYRADKRRIKKLRRCC